MVLVAPPDKASAYLVAESLHLMGLCVAAARAHF